MASKNKKSKKEGNPPDEQAGEDANVSVVRISPTSTKSARAIRELKQLGLHFGKVASHFPLGTTTTTYLNWKVQFQTEMDQYDLSDALFVEPGSAMHMDQEVEQQTQKTVYHMIVHCVSDSTVRAVITTALAEHTGFAAWEALRAHFIGDEQAYLQSIESKFEDFQLVADEPWSVFETRFTTLLNELSIAGVSKLPHQMKARMMGAIQESNRKDAQGQHVFSRLHTTNRIKEDLDFPQWLMAMRIEAQKIQDELTKKGSSSKRVREEEPEQSHEVSFAGDAQPASSRPAPTTFQHPCRNFQKFGTCKYGSDCKFSHSVSRGNNSQSHGRMMGNNRNGQGGMNGNFNRNSNNGGQGGPFSSGNGSSNGSNSNGRNGSGVCWQFAATNKCSRGAQCRFQHVSGSSMKPEVQFAEVMQVQGDHIVLDDPKAKKKGAHRIIGDSAASVHLTPRRDFIRNLRPLNHPIEIRGAFGKTSIATHYGDGFIPVGDGHVLSMPEVVLCESLQDTLLCLVRLLKDGHSLDVNESGGTFFDRTGEFAIPISLKGNIFTFMIESQHESLPKEEANVTTRSMESRQVEPEAKEHAAEPPVAAASPLPVLQESASSIPPSSLLAHARYGHRCGRKIDQLVEHNAADGLVITRKHPSHKLLVAKCDACLLAKSTRVAFGKSMNHIAEAPNDKLVADVIGPICVREKGEDGSVKEVKYYISMLTDVFSRNCAALIMPDKRPSDHVIAYWHRSKVETGRELKHFHTDGGKEYNHAESALVDRGVKVTRTPIHTPEWNAVAERGNRDTVEMTRSLCFHAYLDPNEFWRYAVETAVFIRNRVTVVQHLNKTPYELFTGRKPNLSLLRVFGCKATVHSTELHPGKFDARGQIGIFVGYDMVRDLCYRVWVNGRIIVSRDVRFDEQVFPGASEKSEADKVELQERIAKCLPTPSPLNPMRESADLSAMDAQEDVSDSSSSESADESMPQVDRATMKKIAASEKVALNKAQEHPHRRSARARIATKHTGLNPDDFGRMAFTVEHDATTPSKPLRASDVPIPSTVRRALASPFAAQWQAAMDKEMSSLRAHAVFAVVDRPAAGVNVVTCKFVFAVKEKNGEVLRFKARLVACGYTQQEGVDYVETYAQVARLKTVRVFLAMVTIRDLHLELMDVETAYLNAPLKEQVYMAQPEGYASGGEGAVWLLKKALYGLKQSGREWHQMIDAFIQSLGFVPCKTDSCLYAKTSRRGHVMLILLYVDDIPGAFCEEDRAEWEEIKAAFAARYKIKFLGEADWFLGMRITRDRARKLLFLDQQSYVESVLEEFRMEECQVATHPGTQEELRKDQCPNTPEEVEAMRRIPYRAAVGSLNYVMQCTRVDIRYAVHLVAQFAQNPGAIHWRAVLQILRYLAGTKHYGLLYDGNVNADAAPTFSTPHTSNAPSKSLLTLMADAAHANCPETRYSTTAHVAYLGRCLVDWMLHKQPTVALSSCEAEYMAISDAVQTAMWLKQLLEEVAFTGSNTHGGADASPIPLLLSDSRSAIALAQNDTLHSRSKHIDIRHHFIRDAVHKKIIVLEWVSTHDQLADIMTKTLPPRTFIKLRDSLVHPNPFTAQAAL